MSTAEYKKLISAVRMRRQLASALALLEWDEQVNLPAAAAGGRAEQISALSTVLHEKNTAEDYVDLLRNLKGSVELSAAEKKLVTEIWREVERNLKTPPELVAAIAQAQSETYSVWVEARKENSFSVVKPLLRNLFALKKELAAVLSDGGEHYDALLDLFEPGLTSAETTEYFSALQPELTKLLSQVGAGVVKNPARAEYPIETQKKICSYAAELMGFDFRRGRLDVAVHPFCSEFGFDDVRLTTRYLDTDFAPSLYGTMHEAGHGLYEQGYLPEHASTPLGEFCSMAIHESQSRLWENLVGRSKGFLSFLYPKLQTAFPQALSGVDFDSLYRYLNRVSPSLIRVEADEVSYGLHIIIRFELERDLMSGALSIDDAPEAWNQKYRDYLGLTPPDELQGILQDVHWYAGHFGYFPTYLLGSSYAAQIMKAAKRDLPELESAIQRGELASLKLWLNEKIHRHGKLYSAKELMKNATGEFPRPQYMIEYLKEKYQ